MPPRGYRKRLRLPPLGIDYSIGRAVVAVDPPPPASARCSLCGLIKVVAAGHKPECAWSDEYWRRAAGRAAAPLQRNTPPDARTPDGE